MLTVNKIHADLLAKYGPNDDRSSYSNAEAGYRFAVNFDCLDSESWSEAQQRISASMGMISERMEFANDGEAAIIMREAYKNL